MPSSYCTLTPHPAPMQANNPARRQITTANMKKITLYTLFLLMLQTLPAIAQERGASMNDTLNKLDNLIIRSAVKQSFFPEERVYLHFDNSAYYLGEEIWFKAYVTSGSNDTPTDISKVLYVELVAPEGYVVRTNKYKIDENGTCNGSFELNRLLLSGYFEIRAYTRYMLNRGKSAIFSRVFPVFDKVNADNWEFMNMLDRRRGFLTDVETDDTRQGLDREVEWVTATLPDTDIKFYPEGGHLVSGLESRIAFEVFGSDGINASNSITILANGKELLTATPEHMGKGCFTLTPEEGTEYTAILQGGKKRNKFTLPDVEEEGVSVKVEESAGSIGISVKNSLANDTEMGCAVFHRGRNSFYERFSSNDREMFFAVDKSSLAEGVNRVIVFIDDSIPLAERMFFVTHEKASHNGHKSVRLKVKGNGKEINSLNLKPHEKIMLEIEREDGKPIAEGSFSLAVNDAKYRHATSYTYNMYTYMLLGSEVKGYIPNAANYFDPSNPNRARELDLIMLTHGWTSYDWNKLSRKEASLEQPIEKGIVVKGLYVKKEPNRKIGSLNKFKVTSKGNCDVRFNITYKDSILTKYDFKTDKNGEFRLQTEDFFGKRVAQLIPDFEYFHRPKDSIFSFVLDRYFSPEMRLYDYWERNLGRAATSEELKKEKEMMVKINPFEYLLSNVDVISKRKKDPFYRPPRSEMRFDFLDEWEYAQDVTYLNRIPAWSSSQYGYYWPDIPPRWDSPSAFDTNPAISSFDTWAMRNSDHVHSSDNTGTRMEGVGIPTTIPDPAFNNTFIAFDILRSAFWRHNLNWCYWIQSIVVDGEYSSDSIPRADKEYLKGVNPEKMTNFKEIVIRSDENTRNYYELWEKGRPTREKRRGNYVYYNFYHSFIDKTAISPRNGNIDNAPDAIIYDIPDYGNIRDMNNTGTPNYVACFIPNSQEDAARGIIPILSHYGTSRYTMVYGYTESKQFYAPDYSKMRPDSTTADYRRTLFWIPDAKLTEDGRIEAEFYNSTQAKNIAVDIEGYSKGTFYGNNGNIVTREADGSPIDGIRKLKVTPIAGIDNPDLLVHCFKLTEEGRKLYTAGDYEKAFESFSEAAALGYADAIYNTAVCCIEGKGTEKDSVAAFSYFRKAANLGNIKSLHNFASCYKHGIGTLKNDTLAIQYYTQSANKGNAASQTTLGNCYINGDGVQKDSLKAIEWYSKAAEQNEPYALFAIANIMEKEDSVAGYSKRELRARPTIEYLTKAAKNGHAEAQYKLACCYDNGKYVKKSRKKAFNWHLHAASNGHPKAMERVGHCYEKGRGVKKNERIAAHWYRLAEMSGSETAKKKMEWYNIFHFFE